jgi:hypothetical protein
VEIVLMRIRVAASFFFLAALLLLGVQTAKAEEEVPAEREVEESRNVNVQYTQVRARISPAFELALPSGKVTLSFTQPFNYLDLSFYLGYAVIAGDINTELTFAYNIKRFRPYVKLILRTDFENLVAPRVSGSGVQLLPTEKYISRNRGFDTGVEYRISPKLQLIPSFVLDDVFKGSLTTSRVIDEGLDLAPRLSLQYDSLTAIDPSSSLQFDGFYFRTFLTALFRNGFDRPVELRNENLLLDYFNINRNWFFLIRGSLNYPLAVWDKELASFSQLGGFETIRGYSYNSISAYTFLLATLDVERELLKTRELKLLKGRIRLHQFRLKLLADSLLYQASIGLGSDLKYLASLGTGFSFVISGRRNSHFRTEFYAAQGLQSGEWPILYFRTSLFNLERSL